MKKERTMKLSLPKEELMSPGHLACQGCGATVAMRYVLKALGLKTVVCIPACCWSVIDGPFPHSSLSIPVLHCAFETAASVEHHHERFSFRKKTGGGMRPRPGWCEDYDLAVAPLSFLVTGPLPPPSRMFAALAPALCRW